MLSSGFARDVGGIIAATYGEDGVNRFDAPVQYVFAAATMREAQPLLDAFPADAADAFEWISTAQFGRVHPQLKTRVDDVDGQRVIGLAPRLRRAPRLVAGQIDAGRRAERWGRGVQR